MIDDGPGTIPRPDGTLVDGVTPATAYLDVPAIEAARLPETQELVARVEGLSQMFPRGVATDGAIVHRHYGVTPEDSYGMPEETTEPQPGPVLRVRTECELRDELGLEPQTGPSQYGPPEGEAFPTNVELERLRDGGWDIENLESIPTARFEGVRRIVEGEQRGAARRTAAAS